MVILSLARQWRRQKLEFDLTQEWKKDFAGRFFLFVIIIDAYKYISFIFRANLPLIKLPNLIHKINQLSWTNFNGNCF